MGWRGAVLGGSIFTVVLLVAILWYLFSYKKLSPKLPQKTSTETPPAPKSFTANIVGGGIAPTPIESIGFYAPDNAYYVAAVIPGTPDLVVLQIQFVPNTWNVYSTISRVMVNGSMRRRVTAVELEQIYTEAKVASAEKYGDKYKLTNIVGSDTPLNN